MPRYFPDELLRCLRNDIAWASLLKQLEWPHKLRGGQLVFLCPRCNVLSPGLSETETGSLSQKA